MLDYHLKRKTLTFFTKRSSSYRMRLIFSLIIVLSILLPPFTAPAGDLCVPGHCFTVDMGKKASTENNTGKLPSGNFGVHCIDCHVFSSVPHADIKINEIPSARTFFPLENTALPDNGPQGLFKPPQAA